MANEIIVKLDRKVWKPTSSTSSLVITLPKLEFIKEGDTVTLKVTSNKKIIIEKL